MESNDSPQIPDRGRYQISPASLRGTMNSRIFLSLVTVFGPDLKGEINYVPDGLRLSAGSWGSIPNSSLSVCLGFE